MKKFLIIVRHAKSSWDDPHLDDFDRPLNARGKRNAPEMGRRLKRSGIYPDLMLSSPAVRALSTAGMIADVLGYPRHNIATDEKLYLTAATTLLSVINTQADELESIMLFSHNEGITDFVNLLADFHVDNLPTSGLAGIAFDQKSWSQITPHTGHFCFYDFPKNKVGTRYTFAHSTDCDDEHS